MDLKTLTQCSKQIVKIHPGSKGVGLPLLINIIKKKDENDSNSSSSVKLKKVI